ncbi:MAG: FHA domain-containing protein [Verrucomicrobia bacterium]|nr:FHA domain-containing protein [Verrucomicrobiota bacterium]
MPVLVFTSGALSGQQVEIDEGPVVLGRGESADIPLNDGAASSLHARLMPENGDWQIVDLDSSNGTEVNGSAVTSQVLSHQDIVTIGGSQFAFLLESEAPDAVLEAPVAAAPAASDGSQVPEFEPDPEESPVVEAELVVAPPAPEPIAKPSVPEAKAEDVELVEQMSLLADRIRQEVGKTIVGQVDVIDQVLMCVLAGGHSLLIGLPGMAKTLLVSTLATVLDLEFKRVQFTPDLMPTDIIGTDVLETNKDTGDKEFRFIRGPIFCNLLLADEINRTPPKTQAALLEAMQEKRVTAGNETYKLDAPFFVLATQNPIEQEGTYPLPEAQLDRFMFNIWVDYPEQHEEEAIVSATTMGHKPELKAVLSKEDILQLQDVVRKVPVSEHVIKYAIRLVRATRPSNDDAPEVTKTYVSTGAGPRAGQYLVLAAKAMAVLDGRIHVSCSDIRRAAPPVLRHRLLTNFAADSEGLASIDIVHRIIESVEEPGAEDYAGSRPS